jgi:hypothetical protein
VERRRDHAAEQGTGTTRSEPARTSFVQRLLRAPLVVHAAALALLLLVFVPLIGTTSQYTSDEGAAIAQSVRLAHGDGWTMPNSFPVADPRGDAFAIWGSARSGIETFAPFAKHPVYPVMLASADWLGGRAAMVILSIIGGVAVAWLSALIARRLDPALAVPCFWVIGVASPLLFDSYLVVAHTLGAACAAGAALLLLRQLEERRSWVAVAGAALLLIVGLLLRTEMLLMGLALAATLAILGIKRRSRSTIKLAIVPGAAVLVGLGVDRVLQGLILHGGNATTSAVAGESGGLISGRVTAFIDTWVRPSDVTDGAALLILLVAVLGAVAVLLARRTPRERAGVRLFVMLAAVLAVARLAFGSSAVPGLLVAFPLFVAGLAALSRDTFARTPARFLGTTFLLFSAGVLATQYSIGGGAEWGGRYFAIGLPVIVPVLLLALREVGRRLDRQTARIAVASVLVVSCAYGVLAISTLRDGHQAVDRVVAGIDAATHEQVPSDGGAPVVVTTQSGLGRFAFPVVDRSRWLSIPDGRLAEYAQRLQGLGVGPITFVSGDPSEDLPKFDGLFTARDTTEPAPGWTITTLEPCPAPNECSPNG